MIEVKDLSKKLAGSDILNGVSMHVGKGQIYGLVGPNGAGKTTLIRHLTGIYKADSGEVLIDGEPVYENASVKKKIAFIADESFYFAQANTLDMMKYYKGMYESFDEGKFCELEEFFPNIDVKKNIRKLSKGMKKQVAFWLMIATNPELLILDEPVDGLDPVMRRQVWTLLLKEVEERGMTVVISSHNLRELEDVCNHVGIMNKGRVIIEKSLADLHGNICKLQVACANGMPFIPEGYKVLHMSNTGRVYTIIIEGDPDTVKESILGRDDDVTLVDMLPLTLEEIFIYELGGEDYEVKDILF